MTQTQRQIGERERQAQKQTKKERGCIDRQESGGTETKKSKEKKKRKSKKVQIMTKF